MTPDGTRMSATTRGGPSGSGRLTTAPQPLASSPSGPPLVVARASATRPVAPEVRLPGVGGGAVKEPNRRGHRSPEPMPLAPMLVLFGALALAGCGRARKPQLFERLPPERTGVTFVNRLPDDTAFSILDYMYYYDGGGVAVGDVNNDGLPDLYFTSNLGSNRLYLNKGNYRFEDITERAGVADTGGWKTGVTMADVK